MSVTPKDLFGRPDNPNHLGGADAVEDLAATGLALHQTAITQTGQVARDVGLAHTYLLDVHSGHTHRLIVAAGGHLSFPCTVTGWPASSCSL